MRWIVLLFLGLASLIYAPVASACSCMKLTPSEGLTSSFAVFTGEVTDIEKNEATRFGGREVTLRVHKVWKGEPAEELKVHTAGSSAACGYSFTKGVTYLVYAIRDDADPLRVSLCSRTAPVDQAKEDLDFLGKPAHVVEAKKKKGCSAVRGSAAEHTWAWFTLFIGGLTLGVRRLV
jgi:hypothetical protein